MAKGIEVDVNKSSDALLKKQDYFLVDKNLIKKLKQYQKAK